MAAAVLLVMMACRGSTLGADRTWDESAIRQLQARQEDAWNRHDATAYAALFTDDGDVVNVVGWWWKGRRVAVAHVRWTMEGAMTPPSIPEPRQGIQIQVLHKRGAIWRIAAFQNTNSLPEVAFPTVGRF